MADAYDFQIESMKFRLATSDNFPYVRGTAPFRKEQFDSSPTPGDQSLSGWWVRGQFSFHRGEGLKYYEVLEGEEVLSRYWTSDKLDVFTTPGEVVLDKSWITVTASAGTPTYICNYNGTNSNVLFTKTAGTVFASQGGSAPSAVTLNGAGAVAGPVAGDQNNTYIAVDRTGPVREVQRYSAAVPPVYADTLWTASSPIGGLWSVKDRLWIVDGLYDLYVVSNNPAAKPTALSSPVCRFPMKVTSVTDGGSAVFLSCLNKVYSITLNTDGSVPTLTAPAVAAEMPSGEIVRTIRAYMGVLCIVTNKGVRFAAITGNNLTVGPLVVKFYNSECINIGAKGNRVYAVGQQTSSSTAVTGWEFDLSEPLSPDSLVYPYRKVWTGPTGIADGGFIEGWFDQMYAFGGITMESWSTGGVLASSGTLQTGYHRLGTLDAKSFRTVTIRAEGSGGTIQVSQVQSDGTTTSLGTMDLATTKTATYAFSLSSPVERVALKFTVSRSGTDNTVGPTFLGYQIKALPVPERQRILKVPLTLTDELTLRRGTRVGHRGKAYEDAKALEALESSTAIVTFTDHRTGETGSAYIDSVDFQGDKPSSENSNGFGGIAYVTLRVLS